MIVIFEALMHFAIVDMSLHLPFFRADYTTRDYTIMSHDLQVWPYHGQLGTIAQKSDNSHLSGRIFIHRFHKVIHMEFVWIHVDSVGNCRLIHLIHKEMPSFCG